MIDSGELTADAARAYHLAVFEGLLRYIRDGHPFALGTEAVDEQTSVRCTFDSGLLSPYMAQLAGSLGGSLPEDAPVTGSSR